MIINKQGQKVLEELLRNPDKIISKQKHSRFGEIIQVKTPNHYGAWFTEDNKLICFIEP
ncbi:MAG: hypothetical protein H6620_12685 [Halobacteriovoraceae bacterium]|nr:hypothetical protein [Halobacteriovoraceae bacterium]